MIGIYKITNKLNDKSYIGKSIDIEKRFKGTSLRYPQIVEENMILPFINQ